MIELTAEQLLMLTPREAGAIFKGGKTEIAAAFKRIAAIWHPDHSAHPRATEVMQRLIELRDAAIGKTPIAEAAGNAEHIFEKADGAKLQMTIRRARKIDAGTLYVGSRTIAYEVGSEFESLAETAAAFEPKFCDEKMRLAMAPFLPIKALDAKTVDGRLMVYERDPDRVLMADLIDAGLDIPPRHVAWMITKMMHIVAWLSTMKLSIGDMGPDNLLVDPKTHLVALTGPALFATPYGKRPASLPQRTIDVATQLRAKKAVADATIDLELVRLTARELLGDSAGTRLLRDPNVPEALSLWLTTPANADAIKDFEGWERVREKAFGPRKFVVWNVDPADIYGR